MSIKLKIGTRGSPLALAQATIVRGLLIATGLIEPDAIETIVIRTSGDRIQDRSLADIGGKGLFTKEIEEALSDGRIDMAVHSLKDLPAWLPEGLFLSAVLPREDPRDALLSSVATSIATLPHGARVGTSSPRRRALLFHQRPDLDIVEFRGNVGTRLAKLEAGEVDATMLAVAGMKRLGLSVDFHPLDVNEMLPAGGQGAIGLESRIGDSVTNALCAAIGDKSAAIELSAERALQYAIDGSCRTPMGVLARLRGDHVTLDALVARVDGSTVIRKSAQGSRNDAARLGADLGQAIKAEMPPDFFAGAAIINA